MLLTLLINGFRVPMFVNMLITRLGIISPTLIVTTVRHVTDKSGPEAGSNNIQNCHYEGFVKINDLQTLRRYC